MIFGGASSGITWLQHFEFYEEMGMSEYIETDRSQYFDLFDRTEGRRVTCSLNK